MCGKKELPFLFIFDYSMKIWFDFVYVRLLRRLGSWLLSHSGFSKFVLSALLSRCWNHFRLIFIWKTPVREMELLRLNPLRFRFSVKKKGWRWLLSHFSSLKVVLSALLSRCRSRFPFYLLSESFLTDWSCIGLTRCGSCFSLRKEWLELVACAFRFLESCTFQRCFSLPKPISG